MTALELERVGGKAMRECANVIKHRPYKVPDIKSIERGRSM